MNLDLYRVILADLETVAQGGITQAEAFANLRDSVPAIFPAEPTQAEIKAVTDSPEWKAFDGQARKIFAKAYFSAPRMVRLSDDKKAAAVQVDNTTHREEFILDTWSEDNKASKSYSPVRAKIRKASQDYVRVAFRQNVTMLIPAAIDAPEKADTATDEKLPDPTGTLALVTQALQILSEKKPDGALALLNGLDSLVKYARPYVAEGKVVPAKA
jgi:hypothetical protein